MIDSMEKSVRTDHPWSFSVAAWGAVGKRTSEAVRRCSESAKDRLVPPLATTADMMSLFKVLAFLWPWHVMANRDKLAVNCSPAPGGGCKGPHPARKEWPRERCRQSEGQ